MKWKRFLKNKKEFSNKGEYVLMDKTKKTMNDSRRHFQLWNLFSKHFEVEFKVRRVFYVVEGYIAHVFRFWNLVMAHSSLRNPNSQAIFD